MSRRVVILDRDGTLNVDRPDYVKTLAELVVEPRAADGVARFTAAGYAVLVASNQSCVGKGLITAERLAEINRELERRLSLSGARIDAWYICPHVDADRCDCRKPLPGLAIRAQREWGFDPAATWAIGDAARDAAMARGAGCRPAFVMTGKGQREAPKAPEVPRFADLVEFAAAVLA
jgi:D-glycero-D-manno-heptose 1,7-bisphosphate phosphatase